MTVLSCPMPGCGFQTEDVDVVGAVAVLNVHAHIHSVPQQAAPPIQRAPKLERPKINLNATTEDWNAFMHRWDTFRLGSGITDAAAPAQLLECAHDQLANIILRADPAFTTVPIADAIKTFKSLAVVPVALGVLRADLSSMRQGPEEPFHTPIQPVCRVRQKPVNLKQTFLGPVLVATLTTMDKSITPTIWFGTSS